MSSSHNNSNQSVPDSPQKNLFDDIRNGTYDVNRSVYCLSMYRVPEPIRNLRESAYTPGVVSIGPLHSHKSHLQPMQAIKNSYLFSLLGRMSTLTVYQHIPEKDRKSQSLDDCLRQMKCLLDDANNCYDSNVRDKLNEEMLVLDGCFILEFLYVLYHLKCHIPLPGSNAPERGGAPERGDPFFGSTLTPVNLRIDLMLLENQLPFFVLQNLFDNTLKKIQEACDENAIPPLRGLIIECFKTLTCPGIASALAAREDNQLNEGSENQHIISVDEDKHILQIMHRYYYPYDRYYGSYHDCTDDNVFLHPASDLDHAGVNFEADEGLTLKEGQFIQPGPIKWWFRRATFKIPPLVMCSSTDILFRNFIAFEQVAPGVPYPFTSYAFLMDRLVDTEKDVQLLQKAKVIHNLIGCNEEASKLINNLCTEVSLGYFLFQGVCREVRDYRRHPWPNFRAELGRKYFSSPWTSVAFCLAFLSFGIQIRSFVRSFSG